MSTAAINNSYLLRNGYQGTISAQVQQVLANGQSTAAAAQGVNITSACTDGSDDGKIGLWEKIKCAVAGPVKSIFNFAKDIFTNPGKALLTLGTIAACVAFPPLGVAMAAVGVVTGAASVVKSGIAAANATTDAEAKAAWENIGSGTFQTVMSAVGVKAGLNAMKGTAGSAMSELKSGAKLTDKATAFWKDIKTFGRGGKTAGTGYKSAVLQDAYKGFRKSGDGVLTSVAKAVKQTATNAWENSNLGSNIKNATKGKTKFGDKVKGTYEGIKKTFKDNRTAKLAAKDARKMQKYQDKMDDLNKQLADATDDTVRKNLETDIKDLQSKIDDFNTKSSTAAKTQKRADELDETATKAEAHSKKVSTQTEKQSAVRDLRSQKAELQKQQTEAMDSLNSAAKKLHSKEYTTEAEYTALKNQITEARSTGEALNSQITEINGKITEIQTAGTAPEGSKAVTKEARTAAKTSKTAAKDAKTTANTAKKTAETTQSSYTQAQRGTLERTQRLLKDELSDLQAAKKALKSGESLTSKQTARMTEINSQLSKIQTDLAGFAPADPNSLAYQAAFQGKTSPLATLNENYTNLSGSLGRFGAVATTSHTLLEQPNSDAKMAALHRIYPTGVTGNSGFVYNPYLGIQ